MKTELQVLSEQELLGKKFKIYGTYEEPLFLAKDVAEWIGHSQVSKMLDTVDDHSFFITENNIAVLAHDLNDQGFAAQISKFI